MKRFFAPIIALTISISASSQHYRPSKEITAEELLYHVGILASDSLQGRYPGTTHDRVSAKYIKDRLRSFGLEMLGSGGYQFFVIEKPLPARLVNPHLTIDGKRLTLGVDFSALPARTSDSLCASAVFVGNGQGADYNGLDARHKWAVLSPDRDTLSGSGEMVLLDFSRISAAKEQGAAGVIVLSPDNGTAAIMPKGSTHNYGIPTFILGKESSKSLSDKVTNRNGYQSQPVLICGRVEKSFDELHTQNVVALLPGSNHRLANEYVVIGAHYDHLGLGGANSQMPDTVAVHNGADDNASGVSVMLEIAQKMASERSSIQRSVVFVAFGAEELGLVGSQRFVESGIIPVANIKAMVNLDMVGRMVDGRLEISGTRTAAQSEQILNKLNADSALRLTLTPGGFGPSDHASFYAKDIPVFFITTGAHSDYHTPFDDTDRVNAEGMHRVADYTYRLAHRLASMDSSLTFTKSARQMMPTRSRSTLKVTLGIIPDVSGSSANGLKAIGVTDGKPAAQAGMKNGDIIVAINGKPVTNINNYMELLSELKPSTTATVVVERQGAIITLTVNL